MASLIHSALPNSRRPITFVEPSLSVKGCVSLMTLQNIGALVVANTGTERKIIGMVTEREIVRQCVHAGLNPNDTTAGEIAHQEISILDAHDPIEKAMEVITQTKRRHVLIHEEGRLTAILSIGDLLFYVLEDKSRVIAHLENYIHS